MGGVSNNNRFYFSVKQEQVIDQCRLFDEEDDGKSCYVKLDNKELVRYTEWCSSADSKCNWDDAVLVAEFNATEKEMSGRIIRA